MGGVMGTSGVATLVGESRDIGWLGIFRLGLVQAAIGAIVVITTSTLNRVLVVELALPALVPGLLVALRRGAATPAEGGLSRPVRRCEP